MMSQAAAQLGRCTTGDSDWMGQAAHNKIVSLIWGIADDVLRDLFRRGEYPDALLPGTESTAYLWN
jgi:hypothetical protein